MQKHSVNLVIRRESEPESVKKLRIFLPLAAVVSLLIFVVAFLSSIIYIGKNNSEFNSLGKQIDNLEKRIAQSKNAEGIYTLTVLRIKTIDQLGTGSKKFAPLLTEILKLQSKGITISQASIDKKNSVNFAVTASSSASLDEFVNTLIRADSAKTFSEINSSGIVRDKDGGYLLTISLKPNNSLLQ